ncbi:flippase [Ureibacillus sp. FSL K6-3587]|uniref:flippase n=1 Tax=Ureibacillus sp. FSL K6-3587 TaxID=2954681 RepID=UPI003158D170
MSSLWREKLIKNVFLKKILDSIVGKGAYSIFTLLFSLVCTRLFGAEIFGEYTYAFTIITILSIAAKFGLDNGLIYSLPKNKYKHVSFSFLANFVISILLIVVVWLLTDNKILKLMLPIVWLYSVEYLFFSLYRSDGKFKEFYKINGFLSMVIRIGFVVLLFYILGQNIYSIIIATYISFIFSNIIYFIQNKYKFEKLILDVGLLTYSFPLLLSNMVSLLMGRIDILMLGSLGTKTEVGIYQIVVQISGLISVILVIFISVFAPRVANYYHNGEIEKIRQLYTKTTRVLFILSLMITMMIILLSEFILSIFGKDFINGQMALIYMCIGQFVNVAVGAVWTLMSMTGKPKFQLYSNIISLILSVILNLLLIPKFGMNGAAISTMFTISFTNIIGYVVVKKEFKVKVFKFI